MFQRAKRYLCGRYFRKTAYSERSVKIGVHVIYVHIIMMFRN
jgi:hypothetical protein